MLLDPGMIFGTGAHASTQMCMMALEDAVSGGETVIDLGSGSGILSITALLLGAKSAVGVDIDPKAEDIARENAAINGLHADRFTAVTGDQKSVDFLSGGTQDLTYIAVRMALVDMLYTEKTPICFDESFSRQDNLRARSMMKAIAYLSGEGYQSFIFTCRNRETVLAGEMKCGAAIFKLSVDNGATG